MYSKNRMKTKISKRLLIWGVGTHHPVVAIFRKIPQLFRHFQLIVAHVRSIGRNELVLDFSWANLVIARAVICAMAITFLGRVTLGGIEIHFY